MRSSRVLGPLALVVTLGVACPPAAAGWAAGMTSVTGNSTSATNPVVDISATPSGWISVAYGDAQVAVPPNWRVMTHAWCGGGPPIIQLGNVINNLLCLTGPMPPKVTITPLVSVPARYRHEQQTTLNGIPVLRAPRAGTTISAYFVPSLHVTVSATSALGERVVESLTASPRSVVLAPGTAPAIPSSWQRLRFQGLTFATPGKWPVLYTLSDLRGYNTEPRPPSSGEPELRQEPRHNVLGITIPATNTTNSPRWPPDRLWATHVEPRPREAVVL
jgi:hypothetical protein